MTTKPSREEQMRKVAFYVGVARYAHTHGCHGMLQKTADAGTLITLAALGVPVASYIMGRHAGRFAGNLYGNASTPSASSLAGREYDLATASTQRLIDEINAGRVNKVVADTLREPEEEAARKKPKPAFSTPSLLRYGR